MYYIGLLSGTSIDNIDAAIVKFNESAQIEILHTHAHPIPLDVKNQTLDLSQSGQTSLKEVGELDSKWGSLFADSVNTLIKQSNFDPKKIIAIGSHGQTLWHQSKGALPFTMQIGDPNIIAKKTGIMTVADFRRADVALGGQGAPLAPGFHQHFFSSTTKDRIIVNLGGIANISYLPADPHQSIIGYDTGPANSLLDSWCMMHQQTHYDANGTWAQAGEIKSKLLNTLLTDNYFSRPYPKSTGKDYFNIKWLTDYLNHESSNIIHPQEAQNIQATLTELTAVTLSNAILALSLKDKPEIVLCGGGAHNNYLISRIQHHLGNNFIIFNTEKLGVGPDWVEAALFAWLAKANIDKIPLDYTKITGASNPTVLGARFIP